MTDTLPADPDTAADIEAYRRAARAWLDETELPVVPREFEKRAAVLRDWHRRLYDAGWVGIQWPKSVGGQGLTVDHQLAFSLELAHARAPQPVGSIGLEVVGPTILKYGTAQQHDRFIPRLLAGEDVWCQGFSEPDAGSDLASLRTRGVIEGDELVITGHKVWTSWATNADWCAVLVRTGTLESRHRGISYVLVDMRSPGITVNPIAMLNGDAEFNELMFDGVRVPLENVLGEINGGWSLTMDTLGWERAGYAIRRRVENEISFSDMLDTVRSNTTGEPDERLAERIGRLDLELSAFRALSSQTARRLASGDVPSPMDSVDKLVLGRTEQHLAGTALDLLGAYRLAISSRPGGLDAEGISKDYLYGRAASVYGGSAQIQKTLIAERLLGLPKGR
ncbi:acyl-CoA dehydrogenase family protein [Pseudarthrobacter sp. B4EP4b]|uniref:acyl-CoA dehydrogenase family protein n=1 Tax=Pseudarthrobacter sp. B4EP4b TaxID=2590664 RepID=UPI0011531299|nr:acyl-CoA dehydrogenase family protein [Pseudarthrobacter sp. B4EP4b]